ncbi:MAG: AsmA-like C-terminal region-containing protein, partial [Methyloceanibacter sp.]
AHQLTIVDPTLRLRLNGQGGGNWSDLGPLKSGAAFVPTDVLLDSVYVTGGTVEVAKDDGTAHVFRNIDGEASASSLAGPYKVEATYNYEGRQQSIRFSTGFIDDSGRFRVKTALRDPQRSTSYQLDGKVSGLRDVPTYEGAFIMRVSEFEALSTEEPAQGDGAPMTAAGDNESDSEPSKASSEESTPRSLPKTASFFEVKGPLTATPDRAALTGFELTLHASGRPQILKGDVALDFRPPYKAEATFAARWIDFDALFGTAASEDAPTPAAVLRMFADWALDEAAKVGEGALSLDVEQAGLGGDLAGGLTLKLGSVNGGVAIEKLTATLPGENRVSTSGTLRKGTSGPIFEGPVEIDGAGLRALTRWAAGDRAITGQTFVGDFSLSADAKIGEGEIALSNAKGAVSGTPFGGSFHYRAGETNLIKVDFQSDRLDLRETLGGEPIWSAWLPTKNGEAVAKNTSDGTKLLKKLQDDEVRAHLEVGELLLPDIAPGRLSAQLSLSGGNLDVQSLAFVAPGAMTLGGQGKIASVTETPSGQIDLSLQAQSTDSVRALAGLVGFSDRVVKSEHLSALTPFDIKAALVASPEGNATDASLQLDGKVGGSNLALLAKANGTLDQARDAEIDIVGSVTGDRPQALLVLLFPDLPQDRLAEAAGAQGTLSLKLKGVPSKELSGRAALETAVLQLAFEGIGALPEGGTTLNGFASIWTEDASLALPLLGLDPPPSSLGVPLSVSANVASESSKVDLEQIKATVMEQPIEGAAHFGRNGDVTTFDIAATAERVSLPALMGLLVAWERAESTEEMLGAIDDDAAPVWPARGLSLGLLDKAEGTISLSAKTLSLGKPFQVSSGKLQVKVDQGNLAIESVDGTLFGGTFSGSGSLSPRGSGAALTAKANLKQGDLAALTEAIAGVPRAKGVFDLSFDVAGDGLSPPGIVADLSGQGGMTLGAGTLTSFTAAPLRQIAAKAAASNKVATKEQLDADAERIRGELSKGRYAFDPVTLDFEVTNGTMRFAPASLVSKGVETALETYVDLVGLRLDSEWRMQLTSARGAAVPPLTVVFAGPLDDARTIAPAVGTAAIKNKMTIDRLRENVERLETLDVSGGRAPADAAVSEAAAEAKTKAEAEQAAREMTEAEARAARQRAAAEKAAQEQAAREGEAA